MTPDPRGNSPGHVTVIGAANLDINGFSEAPLNMYDSNPGRIEYCPGGVGRNIAENLARLCVDVKLISVIGGDPGGQRIISACREAGIDIEHCEYLSGCASSVYIALLDNNGEMRLALSDMSILEKMSVAHLESKSAIIKNSDAVVLDAGLSASSIDFIIRNFSCCPLYLDPVSVRKSAKVKDCIGAFDTLKLSRMEAEYLSDTAIPLPADNSDPELLSENLKKAGSFFIKKGARRVFITLGKHGVYFKSAKHSFFSPGSFVAPVNTSGGGDAFMAGIVYGSLNGLDDAETVRFALAMGTITVQSATTVAQNMSLELVRSKL